jgi:thymidylate synthase (FAD)
MIEVTYVDHMGSDLSVVNAARVSFGKESEALEWQYLELRNRCGDLIAVLNEKDQKLIHYLAKHEHYSPFGHCFASFHVKAPIFVARQLVKHKFLRWNEISRRYVDDKPEFYVPEVWRGRSADKKQGSEGVVDLQEFNQWGDIYEGRFVEITLGEVVHDDSVQALYLYNKLLQIGVAPEQARMVLPQSTMTEWYWSGSLDAFANMCKLRLKPDTQYETRLVAEQISDVMGKIWPVSWEALVK